MSNTQNVGGVNVGIGGDESALVRACRRAAGALSGLGGNINKLAAGAESRMATMAQKVQDKLNNAFKQPRTASGKFMEADLNATKLVQIGGIFAGVGGAAALAAKNVADLSGSFEQMMTEAAAISGGKSGFGQAFEKMSAEAIRLGADTKYSSTQVAEAFKGLSMAGRTADQAISQMPHVLKLAAASGMELADAGKIVTNIMANYGLGADKMGDANNTLVGTFAGSQVSLQDLGDSFRAVGGIAKISGVGIEELSASLGVLGNTGEAGASAGHGIKIALASLVGGSKQMKEAQKKLGLGKNALADVGFTGVVGQLEKMHAAMKAAGKETEFVGLLFKAFGTRAGPRMAMLVGQGTAAIEAMRQKIEDAKKTDLASFFEEKQMSTFNGAIEQLGGSFESLKLTLGEALLPVLKPLVLAFKAMVDVFNGLPGPVKTAAGVFFVGATAVLAFAGAIGGLMIAVGLAMPGLGALAKLIGVDMVAAPGLAAAKVLKFGAVLGKVGLVLVVFTAAFKATNFILKLFGGGVKDSTSLTDVFGDALKDATGSMRGLQRQAVGLIITFLQLIATIPRSIFKDLDRGILDLEQHLLGLGSGLDDGSKDLQAVADAAAAAATPADSLAAALEAAQVQAELGIPTEGFDKADEAIKAALASLKEYADVARTVSEQNERIGLKEGARSIFDVGQGFRADIADAQTKMQAGRGAPGFEGAQEDFKRLMTTRFDTFTVELKEALEKVPFKDFSAALDHARGDLTGWLTDSEMSKFFASVKAPPSPAESVIAGLAGDRAGVLADATDAETFNRFNGYVREASKSVADLSVRLKEEGATFEDMLLVQSAANELAAAKIVTAFNGSKLGVDAHSVEMAKATAALGLLGAEGAAAAAQLTKIAQPEDIGGLLSGRVGTIVDAIAGMFGSNLGEEGRGRVVDALSGAVTDLFAGGGIDGGAIGKALGELIGSTAGGTDLLSTIAGLGGAGVAATGGGAAGTVLGGPPGAAIGAAVAAVVVAAVPMIGDAIEAIADGIKSVALAIPQAFADVAGAIADASGDGRLGDAFAKGLNPMMIGVAYLAAMFVMTGLLVGAVLLPPLTAMAMGFTLVATLLVAVAALLAIVLWPLTILAAVVAAVVLVFVALAAIMVTIAATFAAMVGVFVFLAALSTSTESFKRFQGAMAAVVDKMVKVLEPFWNGMLALVGLFDALMAVLAPFAAAFADSEVVARALFEVVKVAAIVIGAVLMAVGMLATVFIALVSVIANAGAMLITALSVPINAVVGFFLNAIAAMIDGIRAFLNSFGLLGEDLNASLAGAVAGLRDMASAGVANGAAEGLRDLARAAVSLSPDLGAMGSALAELAGLTYEESQARGEELARTKELNEQLTNVPTGYKVALARFRSISPDTGRANVAAEYDTGTAGTNVFIERIDVITNDWRDLISTAQREATRRAFQQNGTDGGGGNNRGE